VQFPDSPPGAGSYGGGVMKRVAFVFAVVVAVFSALCVSGETMSDPGGWVGGGLVASWLVPLIALAIVAWRRPSLAAMVLVALAVAIVAMHVWAAAAPGWWREIENGVGPVRAIVTFAAVGPFAVLALKRTALAGWMLLSIGVVPIFLSGFAPASAPMRVIGVPIAFIGLLFVIAAGRRHTEPPGVSGTTYAPAA